MTDTLSPGLDRAVVTCVVDVALAVEACWRRIGSFGDAGRFLDISSRLVAGEGDIGSVRQVGEEVLEAMVGRSDASYTYVQMKGPMAQFLYHGCVMLKATGPTSCSLTYTISYDQAPMAPARREAERTRISDRFQGAAEAMKRAAERGDRIQ